MRKTIKITFVFALVLFCFMVLFEISRNKLMHEQKYFSNGTFNVDNTISKSSSTPAHREVPDIIFDSYKNLYKKLGGFWTKSEVYRMKSENEPDKLSINNYNKFPEYAGYYVPKEFIDWVDKIDIDNDKKLETIIYHSCRGCNARPRGVDVIKNGVIIFTADGGSLKLESLNNKPGFTIHASGLVLLRAEGFTRITFLQGEDGEFYPDFEDDIKY